MRREIIVCDNCQKDVIHNYYEFGPNDEFGIKEFCQECMNKMGAIEFARHLGLTVERLNIS